MQIQDIKAILDAPPCPKIQATQGPEFDIPPLQLTLIQEPAQQTQPSRDLSNNNYSAQCQNEDTEPCEMLDEQDEVLPDGKRSFHQFMGIKSKRKTILKALLLSTWKPRKLVSKP